jgi:MraZ protein
MLVVGKHIHTIDDKGRVVLPAPIRKHFDDTDTVIVSPGADGQLAVNHPDEFDAYLAREEAKSMTAAARRNVRFLASSAVEQRLDKAGRVVINEELREMADIALGTEVMVSGGYRQAEIWNLDRFEQDRAQALVDQAKRRAKEEAEEAADT